MVFLSLGVVLLLGWLIGFLLEKARLPGFVGIIVVGFLVGPTPIGGFLIDLTGRRWIKRFAVEKRPSLIGENVDRP